MDHTSAMGDSPAHGSTVQRVWCWFTRNSVPLVVFAVSRFGLFLIAYLSLIFLPVHPGGDRSRAFPQNLLLDGWARWDSGWYADIANKGYGLPLNELGQAPTPFFPLYPLLIRLTKPIFQNVYLAGIVVANVAFVFALLVLFRLVSDHYREPVARRSIVLLAVYPFAFFFSAMYTESLFLLVVVCAFYFGERERWVWAGLSAAAAGATRVVGFITILGLIVLYLEQIDFEWRRVRANILWPLLGLLGPGSYMAYLAIRFGNPLEFAKSQLGPAWQGSTDVIRPALMTIRASLSPSALTAGDYPAMDLIHLVVFVLAVVLCVLAWRRPRRAYAIWGLITLLASFADWRSMGRHTTVIFPVFIAAALLLDEAPWYQVVVYISALLLAMFTIVFTHFYWVA